MPARVTSARFVGREAELAELVALLERASDGRAQLAFVTGESGMGKTRLVDELARRALDDGARVLSGECVELGESELPYAPIVGALRTLVRNGDPALDAIGTARAELAQLLPELAGEARRPDAASAATPQARLFEALLTLLDQLGRTQPVLLVIEDIHWADRSTRDFLVFLSHAVCRERVLTVATYRSDELHRRHPLRPALTELERSERAHRLELRPFTREELASQLDGILGDDDLDRSSLIDRLLARSEGNPLFVEELLAAGRDGRGELPPTLRDALMLRVEALSEDAQELLRVVAAARRVEHEVLRAASGLEGRALRDALREAVAAQLLAPDEDGRYAFRHALLREAVHDDLLPGEHGELHEAVACALQKHGGGDLEDLTEIAHHWTSAGDRERALAASVRAAEAAEGVHAAGEAAAALERVLELWPKVEDAEALAGGVSHAQVLERAARNHQAAGEGMRARTLLLRALGEIDAVAEPRVAAMVLERIGHVEWDLGRGADALESYVRALQLLPKGEPSAERAVVLAALARALMLAGRYDQARENCREAIAVARETGARSAEDSALNTLGVCLGALGDPEGGTEALRASMENARADGRSFDLSRAFVNLAEVLFLWGRARDAQRIVHEGLEELRDVRDCRWMTLQLAEIDFHLGDWDEAEAHNRVGIEATGTTRVLYLLGRAELVLGRGDHLEAIELLEEARDRVTSSLEPQWHGPLAALLAQAYRRERRYDDARATVALALERVRAGRSQDVARLARLAAAGVALEADRAEHARALGRASEADEAARRATELLALAKRQPLLAASKAMPMACAHIDDAEAEVLRAQGTPDPALYARAAESWDRLERPYTAALARRRRAEVLAAAGDREGATEAARRARIGAESLGASWLVEELDGLARRARLRLTDEAPAEPAEEPADELGLTAREREVLALLAEGRTNREIGAALFMAEKTASVHVSRILAKLDVRSRTEAAAVAHRLGLAA